MKSTFAFLRVTHLLLSSAKWISHKTLKFQMILVAFSLCMCRNRQLSAYDCNSADIEDVTITTCYKRVDTLKIGWCMLMLLTISLACMHRSGSISMSGLKYAVTEILMNTDFIQWDWNLSNLIVFCDLRPNFYSTGTQTATRHWSKFWCSQD